jgi:chemotaxis protein methyltransferase CheR
VDAAMKERQEQVEELEAELLLEAIWRRHQYDFRGYARSSIVRRLDRARVHFGCSTLSGLQDLILHDPGRFGELLGFLSVKVSDMFRDPTYFRALREHVLPHLRTFPSLKVWIAGCATGEEFWSLAILFREEGLEDRTIFYVTDIDPVALRAAQAGIYDLDRLPLFTQNHRASGGRSSLSDYYTAAYGAAAFDKSLKTRAVFAEHNLALDSVFAECHLVSSRNVLIYFDRELQDRAIRLYKDSLVHGGFLGLGSKETLQFSRHADCFTDFERFERIYRRCEVKPEARETARVAA